MQSKQDSEKLGLEFSLQRPPKLEVDRIPDSRDAEGNLIYPEMDADGDHVHFEMVPMGGDAILWLTVRRGITPMLASNSLRKIANLIDRHGQSILNLLEGKEGSFDEKGELISGPLKLEYDQNGDLIIPDNSVLNRQKSIR